MPELLFDIAGDIGGFERAMHLAEQLALRSANEIQSSFQRASTYIQNNLNEGTLGRLSQGLNNIRTTAVTAAAAFVAFEAAKLTLDALNNAAEQARQKLEGIVKIADQARSAGVGSNFFQQWTAQASALRIESEQLVQVLNRVREATTVRLGTGGNANTSTAQTLLGEHAQVGNIGQADVAGFNALHDQQQRIEFLLDLMARLRSEGKELAALDLADNLFGKDFGNKLREGVDLIGKMKESLHSIKDVEFPPDIVETAKNIHAQLEAAERTMKQGWAPIQQDILRWQNESLQSWANMKTLIADIAAIIGSFYVAVKNIGEEISNWANGLAVVKGLADWARSHPEFAPSGTVFLQPGQGQEDAARRSLATQLGSPGAIQSAMDASRRNAARLGVPFGADTSAPRPDTSPAAATTAQTTALETYTNQLTKSVAVLEAETAAYGKNNVEKSKTVDLAKAEEAARRDAADGKRDSAQLTDDERQAIIKLAEAEGHLKDQMEKLQQAQAGANERANFFGQQLISAVDKIGQSGVKAKDIILDLAKALEKAALQAVLLGSGPFASLLGTSGSGGNVGGLFGGLFGGGGGFFSGLFGGSGYSAASYNTAAAAAAPGLYGPGFSEGGFVGRDGTPTYIPRSAHLPRFEVGGPIPIIAHEGELILNRSQQRNLANGMGSGSIVHSPQYNITGATPEQVIGMLKAYDRQSQRELLQRINRAQKRYG